MAKKYIYILDGSVGGMDRWMWVWVEKVKFVIPHPV